MDGANHNIFTEQPCPTADSPSTGSSRASIIAQDEDTICNPPPSVLQILSDSADQRSMKEDAACVHLTAVDLCDGADGEHHL
ncbi:hypothetical protein PBY51_017902 [Eleginops maclovinus]|uniref:Uncharacterized protein n=1 Tax=Eleginops maclovinus TaxID=56733 RepID=A0AAN8ANC6_ELEMC|nr:hypothetical protein PBY51_017902 [Eleginops maclovinus]